MKKKLLNLVITLITTVVIAKSSNNNIKKNNSECISVAVKADNQSNSPDSLLRGNMIIDAYDTVVFDLSKAVIKGTSVEFPVSIKSDDVVNAFDFSFKYNQMNFTYDSILDLTNYMQPLSWYNLADSTVRFTSYSLQAYSNDTSLVSVSFSIISGQMCSSDLYTIKAYLNGDACTVNVINCLPNSIPDINTNDNIKVYPNPAAEILNVEVPENATVLLLDVQGRQIVLQTNVNANQKQEINVKNIANGIYLLKVYTNSSLSTQKVVINKQ